MEPGIRERLGTHCLNTAIKPAPLVKNSRRAGLMVSIFAGYSKQSLHDKT